MIFFLPRGKDPEIIHPCCLCGLLVFFCVAKRKIFLKKSPKNVFLILPNIFFSTRKVEAPPLMVEVGMVLLLQPVSLALPAPLTPCYGVNTGHILLA